jgi:glycosyltransferase involved in cell wall biosynthesis
MNINSNTPLAVVMATCNGARFLDEQFQSLLQQTLTPELILIFDDASDDDTPSLLEKYAGLRNVSIHRNATRRGVNENFRQAIAAVPPGYDIAICDQDDIWLPTKLATSVAHLHSLRAAPDEPALVYSDCLLVDEKGETISTSVHRQRGQHRYQAVWDTFLFGNMVSGCTIVMNSAMQPVMAALPPTELYIYDAWLAMAAFGWGKIACLPDPLIKYRQHDANLTFSDHQATNRSQRLLHHLSQLWGKDIFLQQEIALARDFQKQFNSRLSPERKKNLQRFLELENKTYLQKKWAFEKSFSPNWLNRFS